TTEDAEDTEEKQQQRVTTTLTEPVLNDCSSLWLFSVSSVVQSLQTSPKAMRAFYVAFVMAAAPLPAQQRPADILLTNGRVITVDPTDRVVQAGADTRRAHHARRGGRA